MSTLVAATRSIATYISVALYVAVVGTPFVLFAIAIRNPAILYKVGDVGVRLGLFLSGIRFTVEGGENIQRHRAAVYAVNHASNIEPPILFTALREVHPKLRILYKAELRKLPILVQAWDLAGFVPLERGNPEQSLPAIDAAAAALTAGNSFLIFPEGTRSIDGAESSTAGYHESAFVSRIAVYSRSTRADAGVLACLLRNAAHGSRTSPLVYDGRVPRTYCGT